MTASIPQCSGDVCTRPPAGPGGIQALHLKGNSVPRDSSPPPWRRVFMTTQTQFQRVSLQVHEFWLRNLAALWRHSPPRLLVPPQALTISTLSPAHLTQAPCPRAWGAEERVTFCPPDCPFSCSQSPGPGSLLTRVDRMPAPVSPPSPATSLPPLFTPASLHPVA